VDDDSFCLMMMMDLMSKKQQKLDLHLASDD
jgi:hypothetical protein